MKKLLAIIVLSLLWSNIGHTFEDLTNVDINELRKLKSYEIKQALNNKKIVGYYADGDYFEETHTSQGVYFGNSKSEGDIIGKWKVENNVLCYQWLKTKSRGERTEFECEVHVFTNNKKTYYFFDIINKNFFAKGYEVSDSPAH